MLAAPFHAFPIMAKPTAMKARPVTRPARTPPSPSPQTPASSERNHFHDAAKRSRANLRVML
jgi:hypothetical protein